MSSTGRRGICKRSCCWSPMGVCGRSGNCPCHVYAVAVQATDDERILRILRAPAEKVKECKRGHPMTPENTYEYVYSGRGKFRICKKCQLLTKRARRNA